MQEALGAVVLMLLLAVVSRWWGTDSRDGVETERRWFPGVAPGEAEKRGSR